MGMMSILLEGYFLYNEHAYLFAYYLYMLSFYIYFGPLNQVSRMGGFSVFVQLENWISVFAS